jgi:hypothetical protein
MMNCYDDCGGDCDDDVIRRVRFPCHLPRLLLRPHPHRRRRPCLVPHFRYRHCRLISVTKIRLKYHKNLKPTKALMKQLLMIMMMVESASFCTKRRHFTSIRKGTKVKNLCLGFFPKFLHSINKEIFDFLI